MLGALCWDAGLGKFLLSVRPAPGMPVGGREGGRFGGGRRWGLGGRIFDGATPPAVSFGYSIISFGGKTAGGGGPEGPVGAGITCFAELPNVAAMMSAPNTATLLRDTPSGCRSTCWFANCFCCCGCMPPGHATGGVSLWIEGGGNVMAVDLRMPVDVITGKESETTTTKLK